MHSELAAAKVALFSRITHGIAMPSFKFFHAADIHLDSPLRGLSRYEGVPVEQVRLATRTALNNLVDAAIEENVAFVIIAGDLYDGDWDDFSTGLFFCGAMRRLNDAGIEVYIAFGNHDADSQQTKRLPLPPNVHHFAHRKPQFFIHEGTGAVLHGQSYKDRDPGGDLAGAYLAPHAGRFNIGVLHTALGGRPPHAPYAPCTPAQLAAKGYDYWALGHVHAHEVVATDPYIVFPGNLQGRNIRECGPKGAVRVTVEDDMVAELDVVAFDAVRWSHIELDVSDCADLAHIEVKVQDALASALQRDAGGRPLMARLTLRGRTALHGSITQRLSILREEVRALAANISDQLWIEKVKLATASTADAVEATAGADEITALLGDGIANADLHASLASNFGLIFGRLPPDMVSDNETLTAAKGGVYENLLKDAASSLRARLEQGRR
jgi:exonuclease SbcD